MLRHAVSRRSGAVAMDALTCGCREEWGAVLTDLIAKAHEFDLFLDLSSRLRRQLLQPVDPDLRCDNIGTGATERTFLLLWAVSCRSRARRSDDSAAPQFVMTSSRARRLACPRLGRLVVTSDPEDLGAIDATVPIVSV